MAASMHHPSGSELPCVCFVHILSVWCMLIYACAVPMQPCPSRPRPHLPGQVSRAQLVSMTGVLCFMLQPSGAGGGTPELRQRRHAVRRRVHSATKAVTRTVLDVATDLEGRLRHASDLTASPGTRPIQEQPETLGLVWEMLSTWLRRSGRSHLFWGLQSAT